MRARLIAAGNSWEKKLSQPILRIGHSPDPDDAFMFCALARRAVRIRDYAIEHVMEDIESLNQMALNGELEVTAISAHAYPSLADRYWVLSTGASMGEGYGPVLVAKNSVSPQELTGKRVAIPERKPPPRFLQGSIWASSFLSFDPSTRSSRPSSLERRRRVF